MIIFKNYLKTKSGDKYITFNFLLECTVGKIARFDSLRRYFALSPFNGFIKTQSWLIYKSYTILNYEKNDFNTLEPIYCRLNETVL